MADQDKVAQLKALITSGQDLDFFFEKLSSPIWISLIKEAGLLDEPPAPVEVSEGVMFPFWPPSRYLVRVAADDPAAVADAFYAVRDSPNPRVWWDTVEALVKMPAEFAGRFVGHVKTWVHHPWHLGIEESVSKLVQHLAEAGRKDETVDLGRNLAALTLPEGTSAGFPWQPLDNWDYETKMPKVAVAMARFGSESVFPLVDELTRFLETKFPDQSGENRRDLSIIWRPAIEDHEQNWDHESEAKLVGAIRTGFEHALGTSPDEAAQVIDRLIGSLWPVVRRIGIHLLIERGDTARTLVERVLTDTELMMDEDYRHELYRLASRRFGDLNPDARQRYLDNARETASTFAARAQERHAARGETEFDQDLYRDLVLKRWLDAVAENLDDATKGELKILAEGAPVEDHPDFASYHMSWVGSGSPLTADEIVKRPVESVLEYFATWKEPEGRFGPGPSIEGLAQNLTEAVAESPDRYAPFARRFLDLDPRYFDALINGVTKSLEKDKAFDWHEILSTCLTSLEKEDAPEASADDRDRTWKASRISVARLLERGLEKPPGVLPIAERNQVWDLLTRLVDDPEPTPEHEARYGPPNMDPLTYSLNTVRGAAFHGTFLFMLWHERNAKEEGQDWNFAERDPAATEVLDEHLDSARDPSVAVRATYGWWLPFVLEKDLNWVTNRSRSLFGMLSSPLDLAAWETYLLRAWGTRREHEALASYWGLYAERIAGLDSKPSDRSLPGDPIERYLALLILGWLHRPEIRDGWPLRSLLGSGKSWIAAAIVEEAGRMIWHTSPDDVTTELANSFEALWDLIRQETQDLESADRRSVLSHFGWWFRSPLPGSWALTQLLELIGEDVQPDPDFAVLERIPDLAAEHPDEVLRVLDYLASKGDREWALRTHEEQIRAVLSVSVNSEVELRRERARKIINQLGRLGLRGLGSLLADQPK